MDKIVLYWRRFLLLEMPKCDFKGPDSIKSFIENQVDRNPKFIFETTSPCLTTISPYTVSNAKI